MIPPHVLEADWASTASSVYALPANVQMFGLCDLQGVHDAHVFTANVVSTHASGWSCPGQYSACRNCGDQRCMDCVGRVMHDECHDSCPDCCTKAASDG